MPRAPKGAKQLELRQLRPETIPKSSVVVIIGKRNSGKSVLAKHLLYYMRDMPAGIVMSCTEDGNGWYSKFVPKLFVHNTFDVKKLQQVLDHQRAMCAEGRGTPMFIVLDDCAYQKNNLDNETMRYLFMNGRHLNIFVLITAQYMNLVPPAARSNIDYLFVLKEPTPNNRRKLFDNYFGVVGSFPHFNDLMDQTTNDYECLCLNNTVPSNNPSDVLFYFRANPKLEFRMGPPAMWDFHRRHYDATRQAAALSQPERLVEITKLTARRQDRQQRQQQQQRRGGIAGTAG